MIQLILALADPTVLVQAMWEQFDPAHRETLTRRLALVIAKAAATPAIIEGESDDE